MEKPAWPGKVTIGSLLAVMAILSLLSACSFTSQASDTPTATPTTPTPTEEYLQAVRAFSLSHGKTLDEVSAVIERLASESDAKAKQIGNMAPFLSMDTRNMSDDRLLALIASQYHLSPEFKQVLISDQAELDGLLLQVKGDQVKLLQIPLPPGIPSNFHISAMATLDRETSMLVSLLNFYSSPQLSRKGPAFEEFPRKFSEAEAQLQEITESWSNAERLLIQWLADSPSSTGLLNHKVTGIKPVSPTVISTTTPVMPTPTWIPVTPTPAPTPIIPAKKKSTFNGECEPSDPHINQLRFHVGRFMISSPTYQQTVTTNWTGTIELKVADAFFGARSEKLQVVAGVPHEKFLKIAPYPELTGYYSATVTGCSEPGRWTISFTNWPDQ